MIKCFGFLKILNLSFKLRSFEFLVFYDSGIWSAHKETSGAPIAIIDATPVSDRGNYTPLYNSRISNGLRHSIGGFG